MKFERFGRDALLVVDIVDPGGWARRIRPSLGDLVDDAVPGEDSVVLTTDPRRLDALVTRLRDQPPTLGRHHSADSDLPPDTEVRIAVELDGPDLDEVARRTGLRRSEVVDRVLGSRLRVAFCGFSPGFAYLTGLPSELHVPRRESPRRSVPAGSVAIAAGYAAVYPSASPGGWHLIGSTEESVWDVACTPPARLVPGTDVRFVPR